MSLNTKKLDQVERLDYFSYHKKQLLPVFQPLLIFGAAINLIFGISLLFAYPETGSVAFFSMTLAAVLILYIAYYVNQSKSMEFFTLVVCGLGVVSILLTIIYFIITPGLIVFSSFALFYFLFAASIISPVLNLRQLLIFLVFVDVAVFALLLTYSHETLNFSISYIVYLSGLFIFVYVSIYKVHQNGALNYQLSTRLYEQSMTDELTGVFNRRAWYLATRKLLLKDDPRTQPITAMLLDIDFFKGVNSSYGQIAGDRVLMKFVGQIQAQLRPKDIIGRLASDQFVVLMPSMPLTVAEMVADQIRNQVQLGSVTHMGHPVTVTCSIGVVCFNGKIEQISQIVQAADAELIEAKRNGRNCICAVEY